jgi:tetratricopeptide (TPR) repeat protein
MPGNVDHFEKAMSQGHSAAWDQNWDRAVAFYRQALDEFPNHPKAISSIALALYELKVFDEALTYYQKACELLPDDPIPAERVSECLELSGKANLAVAAYMRSAELYIKSKDIEKALSIWRKVLTLAPENIMAHSRLAIVFERIGQKAEAVREYLGIAALLQQTGEVPKAMQAVERALQASPESAEAQQALAMLKAGQMLPKISVSKSSGTAQAAPRQGRLAAPSEGFSGDGLDPVASTCQKALSRLAALVFEQMEDEADNQTSRKGMQAIMKGTGLFGLGRADQTKIMLHLSQVVDLQARKEDSQALEELEKANEAGLDDAAIHFDLGYLYFGANRLESALRHLQRSVNNQDYALGSRLLLGQVQLKMGKSQEASIEFLEALRLADMQTVPADQAEEINQLYETIIDEQSRLMDSDAQAKISSSIVELLVRPNWQENLVQARRQLQGSAGEEVSTPIVDMMIQARGGSGHLVQSMNRITQLSKTGKYRAATEEAFHALQYAPTYLPLHILIGEMLFQQGQVNEAAEKFSVVARSFRIRGESSRSIGLYRRIVNLSPMDINARKQLIDMMNDAGQMEEVAEEYLRLAEVYFSLADLVMARETCDLALKISQQSGVSRELKVKVLNKIADIDLQSLDWKRALRAYEQIRNLKPEDEQVRTTLIDLYLRFGQENLAATEISTFISYLSDNHQMGQAVKFLEKLEEERSEQPVVVRQLAEVYRKMGKNSEALEKFDLAGDLYLRKDNTAAAIETVMVILTLNPPNAADYQQLLSDLRKKLK